MYKKGEFLNMKNELFFKNRSKLQLN